MLKLKYEQGERVEHHIKVEKLPDGKFRAVEYVLGPEVIKPAIADSHQAAWSEITTRLNRYDETGDPQV